MEARPARYEDGLRVSPDQHSAVLRQGFSREAVVRQPFGFPDRHSEHRLWQVFVLGHRPSPPFFDPGPAYNAIGPAQVTPAAANPQICPSSITPCNMQPVYGAPSCGSVECDIFGVDRNIKTPYMENYNLNI